ncbi:MAG: Ig-like domain-containing protein, partial [Pseudomonadota bacterium]
DPAGLTDTATVTVTVTDVNNTPIAANDTATTDEDTPISIDVLSNDTDADGDTLIVSVTTAASNGTAVVNGQNVDYTPAADFNGSDSFGYTISDGNGGSDSATVSITINAVNDPPVAIADSGTTPQDTAVTIDVLGNDLDVDADMLSISSVTQPASGTTSIVPAGIFFTPATSGTFTFDYTADDGNTGTSTATVEVVVTAVNAPPVAVADTANTDRGSAITIDVLDNDTDADGDTLSIASVAAAPNGTTSVTPAGVSYTPNGTFLGDDSFTYEVIDGNGGSDSATVTVTVNNNPPVAVDDAASTTMDMAVRISVLVNDTDADAADTLSIATVSDVVNGTAVVDGDDVVFTPTTGLIGEGSFNYEVTDGSGGIDSASVRITISA